MAGLCWMAVTLAFFLSAQHSMAAVDQNRLTEIVDGVLGLYRTDGMFSLAVRIPDDQNQNIQKTLSESDPASEVKKYYANNRVYVGNRLVAAKVLKLDNGGADHAESRVVAHLDELLNNSDNNHPDMLLFYVYASPCVEKCTNNGHPESILNRIGQINWKNSAFVFSKIFKPRVGEVNTPEDLKQALERLGRAIGLGNIYRCDKQDGQMQCRSCSDKEQVAEYCFSNQVNFSDLDNDATAPGKSRQPQPGSSYSPSHWQSPSRRPSRSRSRRPSRSRSPSRRPSRSPSRRPSRRSSVNPSAWVSTNVDSYTGASQGGRGGGKRRRSRNRRMGDG